MPSVSGLDPVLLFLTFATVLKHGLHYLWYSKDSENAEYVGNVSQLFLHPIKSAQGLQPTEAQCTPLGLSSWGLIDRHFQVISSEEEQVLAVNAKTLPVLSSVTVSLQGDVLHLGSPAGGSTQLKWKECMEGSSKKFNGSLHGVPMWGRDCGDSVARWLDGVIGKPGHRLIYADPSLPNRTVKYSTSLPNHLAWTKGAKSADKIAYQDVTPYLIINQSSLDELNSRLDKPMGINRFRPNIVVSGAPALDEDTWRKVIIGDAKFTFIKRCNRCIQTTVDPSTGIRDANQEPLRTLRTYRMNDIPKINSPTMGLNMTLEECGRVKLGDPVYVVRGDTTTLPE